MNRIITVEEAQKLDAVYIDVRSPCEFAVGHVPGAINIPLFTDEERIQVGTIYRAIGVEEAKQNGLSIVSVKLPDIINKIKNLYQTGRTVVVYCWRGGMRSKSVVSVLEIMGIGCFQLLGGYKVYRRYVLDTLAKFKLLPQIVVLCGSTGVGKTQLLTLLSENNIPVIDLEKIANHRGSAFGHIGLDKPETAQNFDAFLLYELQHLNKAPYIVIECESKRIGKVYIADTLFKAMQEGRKILVYTSIETRISRLIDEYTDLFNQNHEAILTSLKSLKKRLGTQKTDKLLADFADQKIREVVRTLLIDYYDPLYGYGKTDSTNYECAINTENLKQAAFEIIYYLEQLGGKPHDCGGSTAFRTGEERTVY